MIKEINSEEFESVINNGRVLVDFYADWCGPCKMLRPILESVVSDEYNIASINVDENEEIAEKYGISSIPCLILFENGNEVKRSVGLISKEEVEGLFNE